VDYLGVDFGQRRVGLARASHDGRLAAPWRTLHVRGREDALDQLTHVVESGDYALVVFGLPLGADGQAGDMARRVKRIGGVLARRTGTSVVFEDEWGTSIDADRSERGDPDAVAATFILQAYLDRSSEGTDG
jgi:putative Holliday junction resolvase